MSYQEEKYLDRFNKQAKVHKLILWTIMVMVVTFTIFMIFKKRNQKVESQAIKVESNEIKTYYIVEKDGIGIGVDFFGPFQARNVDEVFRFLQIHTSEYYGNISFYDIIEVNARYKIETLSKFKLTQIKE